MFDVFVYDVFVHIGSIPPHLKSKKLNAHAVQYRQNGFGAYLVDSVSDPRPNPNPLKGTSRFLKDCKGVMVNVPDGAPMITSPTNAKE